MATCLHPNDAVSSASLRRSSSVHRHWPSSFLRSILNSFRCGRRPSSAPPMPPPPSDSGSVKLADLFKRSSSFSSRFRSEDSVAEKKTTLKKVAKFEDISEAVRLLQREAVQERETGAKSVRSLAKEDAHARATLARMGAIPPLLEIVDHDNDGDDRIGDEIRVQALYALLNLGIGDDLNKAAIVRAGAVHKMLKLITSSTLPPDPSLSEAIVANFLALSASDSNKPIIGSSGAIPFLVDILDETNTRCSPQSKQDSLRALYNLSILPSNIPPILETNLIRFLMASLNNAEHSDRVLSILSNVIAVPEGRKALSVVPSAFPALIDVLSWNDLPNCQEKASYILMVMAHKSYNDRHKMIEAGIGSALLELTLIGSTLAQKRASRILECLRVDKGKSVRNGGFSTAAVSAPIQGGQSSSSSSSSCLGSEGAVSGGKGAVKQLVQESLQSNMRKIVMRANLPQEFVPSENLKSLMSSSTSKSLPF